LACGRRGSSNRITSSGRLNRRRGADPKDDLFDQLEELRGKRIIPDPIYDMAEAIRKKGNVGAHPGHPVVNTNLSEKEAQSVFDIVDQVFEYVYEYPSHVAALKGP